MSSIRCERVASLVMKEVSRIIQTRLKDPRVEGVHIVSVAVSPDLHLARVNYSTLTAIYNEEAMQKGLDSAKPFIRRELKKVLRLRLLPELAFFFDPLIRHGDHMMDLIRGIKASTSHDQEDSH